MSEEFSVTNVSMSADNHLYPYTALIVKAMEEKGWSAFRIHSHDAEHPRDRIQISFKADNMTNLDVLIVVGEDGHRVCLYVYDIIKLPNAKPAELYHLIQKLHSNWIFARWMFDERDKTLQAEWYTHMSEDIESARIVAHAISRLANLVDEVYPTIMQVCGELGMFK